MRPRRILIRSTNWIGDAVMTSPAVHTIRRNFPDAVITLLAVPWVADVFRSSPDVDSIMEYDKKLLYPGKVRGVFKLAQALRRERFDMAILLQNAFEAAFLVWMAGIPVRAGYRRDGRGLLLTHGVEITPEIRARHQVYYYQELLAGLGLTPGPDGLRIPLADSLLAWANTTLDKMLAQPPFLSAVASSSSGVSLDLQPGGQRVPIIGFNPGAAYGPAKRWPAEKFAALAAQLVQHYGAGGCLILVFGTGADRGAAQAIRDSSAQTGAHVVDMTAKTTLCQAMALIQRCQAFVTNDSGLMHVAAGLATPLVAIFGSTDHIATGPFSSNAVILRKEMPCSPCLRSECPQGHLRCLEEISAQEVFAEVVRLVANSDDTKGERHG